MHDRVIERKRYRARESETERDRERKRAREKVGECVRERGAVRRNKVRPSKGWQAKERDAVITRQWAGCRGVKTNSSKAQSENKLGVTQTIRKIRNHTS